MDSLRIISAPSDAAMFEATPIISKSIVKSLPHFFAKLAKLQESAKRSADLTSDEVPPPKKVKHENLAAEEREKRLS